MSKIRLMAFLCIVGLCVSIAHEVGLTRAEAAAQPRGIREVLDSWVTATEKAVVPAAEALPEDKYEFAPVNGAFAGVRTFAEQVKHLAAANHELGAAALGERPRIGARDETAPDSVRTRAQILDYLKDSFVVLHRAAAAVSKVNMEELIKIKTTTKTRPWLVIDAVAHCWNHYGQMVEYLRMNGVVPPASR